MIIDAQREYTEGQLPLSGIQEAVAELKRLLNRARSAGAPVFHVVQRGRRGRGLFDPAGPMAEIIRELTPLEGEVVIAKSLPNGFARTDLDAQLKARSIRKVIFAGFMTHMCVETTVRAALELGYESTVVASACATRDLSDGAGGVVTAAVVHRASLAALADRFAVVVEKPEDIQP